MIKQILMCELYYVFTNSNIIKYNIITNDIEVNFGNC